MNIGFQPLQVRSLDSLNLLLYNMEINQKDWVKNSAALFKEIEEGDCILGIQNQVTLVRRVDIARTRCFYTNEKNERFKLVEVNQIFNDGRSRQRGWDYVAEKIQLGEDPKVGAIRGLAEELGISGPEIEIISVPEENDFDERSSSQTYIGIAAIYNNYSFKCEIPKKYYQSEYVEIQDDKKTIFQWVKI